jgi:hypothetical protein
LSESGDRKYRIKTLEAPETNKQRLGFTAQRYGADKTKKTQLNTISKIGLTDEGGTCKRG